MGSKKLIKRLVLPFMYFRLKHFEMPRAYRSAVANCSVDPKRVVFVDEEHLYMSEPIEKAYMSLLDNHQIAASFCGLGKVDGGGWKKFQQRCIDLAKEIAQARFIVAEQQSSILSGIRFREDSTLLSLESNGESSDNAGVVERIVSEVRFDKPVADCMALTRDCSFDISIVIPAYNAESTIQRALDSVFCQDYPKDRMEVIVVDDCSSDRTFEIARANCERYPNQLRVLKTDKQSGTPARPRNMGLEASKGYFVFFLDADDWLGSEAVRRMISRALNWDSDVLLVKLIGEGGREVPKSMFLGSQPKSDLEDSKVMWTLAPLKLFKRSVVQDIEFPENCMPEDISFVLRAYVAARVVSVAADYDYYHVEAEAGEQNASVTTWSDVDSNLVAYQDVFSFLKTSCPNAKDNDALMRRLFGRDICRTIRAIEADSDNPNVDKQLALLKELVLPFYDERQLATLPSDDLQLLHDALTN